MIAEIRIMSSILCFFSGFVSDRRSDDSPYIKPVTINGMSMVLLTIKAFFTYKPLAMKADDPRCSKPVIMKKIRATFLMFSIVFMRL